MKNRTRVSIVAGVLVAVGAVYTGGWFYLAGTLKSHADTFLARMTGRQIDAACTNLDVGGFPLRIGLDCSAVRASRKRNGETVSVSAGALRSDAELIHPGRVVSRLDGPLQATGPHDTTLEADWESLRASTDLWTDGLLRGVVRTDKLRATIANPVLPAALHVAADEMSARTHRRQSNLEVAFAVSKLSLSGAGLPEALPESDVSGTAVFDGLAHLLQRGSEPAISELRGTKGKLTAFKAELEGGARLSAQGPFSFDEDGRLSGKFKVRIEDVTAWRTTMTQLLPQAQKPLNDASNMLKMLAGDNDAVSMTLTARHGQLLLGIVPVAKLPPI